MKLLKSLFIVIASMTLTGCASLTKLLPVDPLVKSNCPPLTELKDPSFGATTMKLVEVAQQYDKCRTTALRLKGE